MRQLIKIVCQLVETADNRTFFVTDAPIAVQIGSQNGQSLNGLIGIAVISKTCNIEGNSILMTPDSTDQILLTAQDFLSLHSVGSDAQISGHKSCRDGMAACQRIDGARQLFLAFFLCIKFLQKITLYEDLMLQFITQALYHLLIA